ncbi:MAG: hypothetical protein OXP08_02405, partial [bacterium]|nr:hypothetical protein [bacterium]
MPAAQGLDDRLDAQPEFVLGALGAEQLLTDLGDRGGQLGTRLAIPVEPRRGEPAGLRQLALAGAQALQAAAALLGAAGGRGRFRSLALSRSCC